MMRNRIVSILTVLLTTASLFSPTSYAASIIASVSSNKVTLNEVFQLQVVANEIIDNDAINFDQLKSNFQVGSTRYGKSYSYINGDRSNRSEWTVSIAAKSLGSLVIPAFTIDGDQSQPITIHVTKKSNSPAVSDLVDVSETLNKTQLYPDESAELIARIIIKPSLQQIQEPQLIPPSADGLTITPEGEIQQNIEQNNGIEVTIVEQRYRITADKPGNYILSGAGFDGTLIYRSRQTGANTMMPLNTTPRQFQITVEKKPVNYSGQWLPTAKLELNQKWTDADGNTIYASSPFSTKVGESITRELTLDIEGLSTDRFPNIKVNYPASIRVYSEKPQFMQLNNGMTRMTQKQVLIPQKVGQIKLNDVAINWWNSQDKQQQTSKVSGLILDVEQGDAINVAPTIAPTQITQTPNDVTMVTVTASGYWPYLTALFALLWLITLLVAITKRRNTTSPDMTYSSKTTQPTLGRIQTAIDANDIIQTQFNVRQWMKDTPLSESDRQSIEAELDAMSNAAFANPTKNQDDTSWDGKSLMALITKLDKRSASHPKKDDLAPL